MPDIPQMSLKVAPMQFATFTPTSYIPQVADATLLSKSLLMQEARQKESAQALDTIDTALSGIRANLNVAEHDWLDSKANEIRNKIDRQIELGNYQSAIRIAQESARDLKRDTELQNKLTVNQLYNQERARIQSSGIDSLTQRYWDYRNQYSYNGTADWKPTWTPVKDVSLANLQGLAVQLTAEDAKTNNRSWKNRNETLIDSDGNVTTDLTQAVGVRETTSNSGSRNNTTHRKSKEDIEKTFRDLLADSNVSTALGQKFDVSYWAYTDAVKRSEDMSLSEQDRAYAAEEANRLKSELVDENGIVITDYNTWINKKVIPMFRNTEYYNTAISTSNGSGINYGAYLFNRNINRINNADAVVSEAEDVNVEGTPIWFQSIWAPVEHSAGSYGVYFKNE